MLEEFEILCPYCGSAFTTLVDCSAGDQTYIEDCQHCCAPINFGLTVGGNGQVADLRVWRDDE